MTSESGESNKPQYLADNASITYENIAAKLLRDRLYLTALEFHTELSESGRDVPVLGEFFSNPINFENIAPKLDLSLPIHRSSSQATLDSLDLTRYSEDGERVADDRIAVLEFELRKARETISALRATLTVAAVESETSSPLSGSCGSTFGKTEPIKPHEQRALNFLINEYLLMNSYRLTSITFSDENDEQDFEDWDDVGLNIPRPPELLSIYRDMMKQTSHLNLSYANVGCQTEDLSELPNILEMEELKAEVSSLLQEREENLPFLDVENPVECSFPKNTVEELEIAQSRMSDYFEIIDREGKPPEDSDQIHTPLEDEASLSSETDWTTVPFPCGDPAIGTTTLSTEQLQESRRCSLKSFHTEILSRCAIASPLLEEDLICSLQNEAEINLEAIVRILGISLPKIIPNVLLKKREEIIPLLICAVLLHPDPSVKRHLLHTLFNLSKRPHEEERRKIIAGTLLIGQKFSMTLIENEILTLCWEQLNSRYTERRMLIAELSSSLASFVSHGMKSSMILSMLQQMLLEDPDENIREMVVKSLAMIVSYLDENEKYFQCEELALRALEDLSPSVVQTAMETLIPIVAKWALDRNKLHSALLPRLINKLKMQVKANPGTSPVTGIHKKTEDLQRRSVTTITVLQTLLPHSLMYVAASKPILDFISSDTPVMKFRNIENSLNNPKSFFQSDVDAEVILGSFIKYVEQEDFEDWAELNNIFSNLLPDLLNVLEIIDVSQNEVVSAMIKFFKELCISFGHSITTRKVKPSCIELIQKLESSLISSSESKHWPPMAIIPVYLVGVLTAYMTDAAAQEVKLLLERFVCALSLCGAPLETVVFSVSALCEEEKFHEPVLEALWNTVLNTRPLVRAGAAEVLSILPGKINPQLVALRVVPALVTLAGDPDMAVRASSLPLMSSVMSNTILKEVRDKIYMQLQSFLADPYVQDNHALQLPIVETLGSIMGSCEAGFRDEVIIPQLHALAVNVQRVTSHTRKIDLTSALINAFSTAASYPLSKQVISNALLPGLRCLEPLCVQILPHRREIVLLLIRETENRIETQRNMEKSSGMSMVAASAGQGVEDMKQRVTKMFQNKPTTSRSSNLPNFQGIFRKK